jgi:hypothetical protein
MATANGMTHKSSITQAMPIALIQVLIFGTRISFPSLVHRLSEWPQYSAA